jgi:hypothetical protein
MVRDARRLFWTASGDVQSLPLDGGPAATVATGPFAACAIAADADDLFFASGGVGLMRAPIGGGEPVRVVDSKAAVTTPGAVAVDATHLYWLEGAAVLRLNKAMR